MLPMPPDSHFVYLTRLQSIEKELYKAIHKVNLDLNGIDEAEVSLALSNILVRYNKNRVEELLKSKEVEDGV